MTCIVRGCEEEGVTREPIYAVKADRLNQKDVLVCDADLCREHAAMLSWSI